MELVAETFDALFVKAVKHINNAPQYICSPRGQKIKEIIAPTLILTNPRARLIVNSGREVNYGFGVGEFLWYWAGRKDLDSILYYNKRMRHFSDDGSTLNSAYGYRMKTEEYGRRHITQWKACKEILLEDQDSRRALILVNRVHDQIIAVEDGSKDIPCTLSLQFFIRENKLILHAHMRSNDAFWGLTYDLFSFTLFQEMMLLELRAAGITNLTLGEYIHTVGSLHIYERHFKMADDVLEIFLDESFKLADPMESIDANEMSHLIDDEVVLRKGKVAQIDETRYAGGVKWMASQLNVHRKKRDVENLDKS